MGKSEKLPFTLCYTCTKCKIQKCNHEDIEREFIGTWTTDEVNELNSNTIQVTNLQIILLLLQNEC
jgi:hypothetical protein